MLKKREMWGKIQVRIFFKGGGGGGEGGGGGVIAEL